jgi:hypothetical protein
MELYFELADTEVTRRGDSFLLKSGPLEFALEEAPGRLLTTCAPGPAKAVCLSLAKPYQDMQLSVKLQIGRRMRDFRQPLPSHKLRKYFVVLASQTKPEKDLSWAVFDKPVPKMEQLHQLALEAEKENFEFLE